MMKHYPTLILLLTSLISTSNSFADSTIIRSGASDTDSKHLYIQVTSNNAPTQAIKFELCDDRLSQNPCEALFHGNYFSLRDIQNEIKSAKRNQKIDEVTGFIALGSFAILAGMATGGTVYLATGAVAASAGTVSTTVGLTAMFTTAEAGGMLFLSNQGGPIFTLDGNYKNISMNDILSSMIDLIHPMEVGPMVIMNKNTSDLALISEPLSERMSRAWVIKAGDISHDGVGLFAGQIYAQAAGEHQYDSSRQTIYTNDWLFPVNCTKHHCRGEHVKDNQYHAYGSDGIIEYLYPNGKALIYFYQSPPMWKIWAVGEGKQILVLETLYDDLSN